MHVLRFTCRISYDALLGTAPAYHTPIKNKYVSGLRLRVVWICVKACIDVTLYDELFITSITEKIFLSPLR